MVYQCLFEVCFHSLHIQLAVRELGQGVQLNDLPGYHKSGKYLAEMEGDFFGRSGTAVEQVQQFFFLLIQGAAFADAGDLFCGFLNLTQLDAVTHVLDLTVLSAMEFQNTILPEFAQITSLVNQFPIIGIQRILQEGFCGLFRISIVTQGQNGTGDADLADLTGASV